MHTRKIEKNKRKVTRPENTKIIEEKENDNLKKTRIEKR